MTELTSHERIAARRESERLADLAAEAAELAKRSSTKLREIYDAAWRELCGAAFREAEKVSPRPWPWLDRHHLRPWYQR